ncbi:hypothetical protein, partial [Caldisericum sp.]|uniref:hypothetical protein n=1 Tax=Caldisericum sp. TaxID=2499687 RepID=UPI003D1019E7
MFFFFDAELWNGDTPLGYLEIKWDEQEGFLKIRRLFNRAKQKDISFIKIFSESSIYRVNQDIKKEFKINDPDFDFVPLLYLAKEKLLKTLKKKAQKEYQSKFLYEPFILHSSPVILVSPMGLGKSIFCYWLALKIQNNLPLIMKDQVLNNFCFPGKVVYLSFEGNEDEISE